jgi:predicted neuraminidase
MTRTLKTILTCAAVLVYALGALTSWSKPLPNADPAFVVAATPPPADADRPVFESTFITPEEEGAIVHAPSICRTSTGDLFAAWYGGTREGAADVCIYFAKRSPGADAPWQELRAIVSRDTARRELGRYVRKVGNAIVFADDADRMWLVYVSIGVGGWAGSSLNVKVSEDLGATWSQSERLTLSPLFNISELVKCKPAPLARGGFAVPIYHENLGLFPEMLWLNRSENGAIRAVKTRICGGRSFIQPSIVPLDGAGAKAFLRRTSQTSAVGFTETNDGGLSWSTPRYLDLPNPNAAVDGLLLSGGRILLAFNDDAHARENLTLALSNGGGRAWTRAAVIEDELGAGPYPYMIRGADGLIHLVYTWHRRRIRHVTFNEAWLLERMEETR